MRIQRRRPVCLIRILLVLILTPALAGCVSIPNPFGGGAPDGADQALSDERESSPPSSGKDEAALRQARDLKMAAKMNQRGQVALVREQYEKAVEEFYGAVTLAPEVAAYHNNLGTALYRNGQIRESLPVFARAMEIDPENVVIRVNLGNALRQLEQYQDATTQYHAALDLDPSHAPAHYELGKLYLRTRDWENAQYRLDRALELDPGYNEVLAARVILHVQMKQFEKAWGDIQTLDRRGKLVNDDLRRTVMEGLERERARQRYQPVH